MELKYLNNLITRRSAVQAVYQNFFSFQPNLEILKKIEFFSNNMPNEFLFEQILNQVFLEWKNFETNLEKILLNKDDIFKLSFCAMAILRCSFAEINISKADYKIIISEYIKISISFCEKEKKIINKILDSYIKSID